MDRVTLTGAAVTLVISLYMAVGSWGALAGGSFQNLLPGPLPVVVNLPAFIAAALLSNNIHAPNAEVFAVLTFLQWVAIGAAALWLRRMKLRAS